MSLAALADRIEAAELSPIGELIASLVDIHGDAAEAELSHLLEGIPTTQLAAALYDFEGIFARARQKLPSGDTWASYGICTGRGFGKTLALSYLVQREVREGRAKHIALIAQNEDMTKQIMVEGPSGLLATSPPWFKAQLVRGEVLWPNGAKAYLYTPEVPGELRGPEHDLAWATELIAWPGATMRKAYDNLMLGLRRGRGRLIWDTSPVARHELLRELLAYAERSPEQHLVVRGSTYENAANLTPAQLKKWIDEYFGTRRGNEELEGIYVDSSEGALWNQAWIDRARRSRPLHYVRKIIAIDPATKKNDNNDPTGIVLEGTTEDEQIHVLEDHTDRLAPEVWGALVVRLYMSEECDCIVTETNRGGDLITAIIKVIARDQGIAVEVLGPKAPTRHNRSTIYIKEVLVADSKGERAKPVATLAERGRISYHGVPLLENEITTWEPDGKSPSPNRLDAHVMGVWELARLDENLPNSRAGFQGIEALAKLIQPSAQGAVDSSGAAALVAALPRDGWGSHI